VVKQRTGERKPYADILCCPHHLTGFVNQPVGIQRVVAMHGDAHTCHRQPTERHQRFQVGIRSGPQPQAGDPGFQGIIEQTEAKRAYAIAMVMRVGWASDNQPHPFRLSGFARGQPVMRDCQTNVAYFGVLARLEAKPICLQQCGQQSIP